MLGEFRQLLLFRAQLRLQLRYPRLHLLGELPLHVFNCVFTKPATARAVEAILQQRLLAVGPIPGALFVEGMEKFVVHLFLVPFLFLHFLHL